MILGPNVTRRHATQPTKLNHFVTAALCVFTRKRQTGADSGQTDRQSNTGTVQAGQTENKLHTYSQLVGTGVKCSITTYCTTFLKMDPTDTASLHC